MFRNTKKCLAHFLMFLCGVVVVREIFLERRAAELSFAWQWNENWFWCWGGQALHGHCAVFLMAGDGLGLVKLGELGCHADQWA